ncbi:MAG: radical SAM protein [Thermodesulfobacteriota bacterium]|nr:radical SAM protein [Thermodesulfobacteriota bacterium]
MRNNDSPTGDRIAFPGQKLFKLNGKDKYPAPHIPGEYIGKDEFSLSPKYLSEIVYWPDRFKMILDGNYFELPPVHFEGIFTLICNFMCPHCTRRVARTKWVKGGTWDPLAEVNKDNTMPLQNLRHVIDQVASFITDDQMGIVWGGGDPTLNPDTYEGLSYANKKGIKSSFLTNGAFLDVNKILELEPVLIRISLNCGTENHHRNFHGYRKKDDFFEKVISNLYSLAKERALRNSKTLIGVSLIVDERNIDDIYCAAKHIVNAQKASSGGIDYVIVRPVFNYKHSKEDWILLGKNTKSNLFDLVSGKGVIWNMLHDVNIPLICIKDSFSLPPSDKLYADTDSNCLSYGLCGEIRHNGDVQLCSDTYGDPDYTIGNIFQNSLKDIWQSNKRFEVIQKINQKKCYKTKCPHNSRGHHINRFLHKIEIKKRQGHTEEVLNWASDIKKYIPQLNHSFFL